MLLIRGLNSSNDSWKNNSIVLFKEASHIFSPLSLLLISLYLFLLEVHFYPLAACSLNNDRIWIEIFYSFICTNNSSIKWIIYYYFNVISVRYIHEPIYRRLIDEENDDNNQRRIWYIVSYPVSLEVYDYIIT
jgi:hypothetical protein